MNERAIELFKQANEKAYEMCAENNHKVGDIDTIWVSIMAGTLAELIVKECAGISEQHNRNYYTSHGQIIANKIKQHFGVE